MWSKLARERHLALPVHLWHLFWVTEPPFRSYSRSKWGHRPKTGSVTKNQRCNEKLTLLYFWSDRFETNRTCSPSIGAHVLLFQSDLTKNTKVLVFRYTEFASRKISKRGSTSAACNLALKTPYPPLPYIFWTVWTWGFTRYHLLYTIPFQKLSKSRLSDRFLGYFWWFCQDYEAKTAIFKIWVFWVISIDA